MSRGLDYSAGRIAGPVIRAAQYSFVCRYVDAPAYAGQKHVTPAEHADLAGSGVDVYLVFESVIGDMLGGYPAGVDHARRAMAGAAWIGYPVGVPIFFACDEHVTPHEIPTCLAYLDGVASVLGRARTGVYGFVELIQAAHDTGAAVAFWLAGRAPAAGSPAHMWQRNDGFTQVGGITCDVNELLIPIPAVVPAEHAEDQVALIELPATPMPMDVGATRWQDVNPANWPLGPEQKTALVPALAVLDSVTTGWAYGLTAGEHPLDNPVVTPQDGPDAQGRMKGSGFIEYARVFWFADGDTRLDWRVTEVLTNVALVGNRSLPPVHLPESSTFLVVRYSAPGGLFLGASA